MDVSNEAPTIDVVADLLESVRVRTTIFCRSSLGAPWGFAVRTHGNPAFHIVTRGDCRLEVEGEAPVRLRTGDLVVLRRGPTHSLRDRAGSPTLWLEDLLAAAPVDAHGRLRYGGDGATTELVCGWFVLEGGADAGPILGSLPPVFHVRASGDDPAPWVSATLDLAAEITSSDAPGAKVVLSRVADTMLAQALRIALADLASDGAGRVHALRDPQIAAAVHLIHERPAEAWTVERLAAEVAYSRSAFALRFRALVGEAPMSYVRRTRLATAATLLQRTNLTLGDVARRSGYASEASLSRAFRRSFGVSPGAYRAEPAAVPA